MIVVFAGAGASKAVAPDVYPTTVEFFERLPDNVRSDKLFELVLNYLQSRARDNSSVIDIEQVLWAIAELKGFLDQVTDGARVAGWFLQGSRLTLPLNSKTDFSNLTGNATSLRKLVGRLVDSINRQVYEWYSKLPEDRSLVNIGHTAGLQRRLDLDLWRRPPRGTVASSEPSGLLTKLHGSVDWSRRADDIFISDPYYKGSDSRHVILYPGFKGVPKEEPFSRFHAYFESAIAAASAILFVGFAFRDEYLNEVLRRATPTRAPIIIIDKNKTLTHMPFAEKRVIHIGKQFDAQSGTEAVNHLKRLSDRISSAP